MVLCAPTGSGKTVLFELALIKLHMAAEQNKTVLQDVKAIYSKQGFYLYVHDKIALDHVLEADQS